MLLLLLASKREGRANNNNNNTDDREEAAETMEEEEEEEKHGAMMQLSQMSSFEPSVSSVASKSSLRQKETKTHEWIEWPRPNKTKRAGDILFWPRNNMKPITYTHWAVYIGRRKPVGNTFVENDNFPEAVVHLWGAADAEDRSMSHDAVVIYSELSEVNCEKDAPRPFCGNYKYDSMYTPMRPSQILHRAFVALEHKFYENEFGGYSVVHNNCEHFATWARYGFQHSAQIGDAFTEVLPAALGLLGGPPGLALGVMANKMLQEGTMKARRHKNNRLDETIKSSYREFHLNNSSGKKDDNAAEKEKKKTKTREEEGKEEATIYEILDEESTHDFSDEKEVDWTVDCLIDYVETSNVQFSQEKHDKYEKHDKHIDDDRPFRVTLKAADENSALYKDRMSGSGQTNVVDIDSRGEIRLGGPASSKPESDLKELAKDLGKIGKEVGKGMLSMLGWAAHEALEAAKKRREAKEKREKEALEKLESLKVPSSLPSTDENNQPRAE